jgi:hypothetical protein
MKITRESASRTLSITLNNEERYNNPKVNNIPMDETIEIEIRYTGGNNCYKAICLDNINIPAIVEAINSCPTP